MDIKKIRGDTDGFVVTWGVGALTENGAKFRAVSSTAMRFPTTITDVEVYDIRTRPDNTVEVDVFVPTSGMGSAGVGRPVKWLKERFPEEILDF